MMGGAEVVGPWRGARDGEQQVAVWPVVETEARGRDEEGGGGIVGVVYAGRGLDGIVAYAGGVTTGVRGIAVGGG
jgi:hypothetical protein